MVMKASGHAVTNMEIEGACYAAYLIRGHELEAERMEAKTSFEHGIAAISQSCIRAAQPRADDTAEQQHASSQHTRDQAENV